MRAIVKKRSEEFLWAIYVKILSLEVRGIVHLANQIMPRHPRQAKRPDFEQAVIVVPALGHHFSFCVRGETQKMPLRPDPQ